MAAKSLSSLLSVLPDLSSYESLYKHFHANPELSQQEYETARTVAMHLRDLKVYDVHTGIGGTGLVGILKNGPGKTILLRADMVRDFRSISYLFQRYSRSMKHV